MANYLNVSDFQTEKQPSPNIFDFSNIQPTQPNIQQPINQPVQTTGFLSELEFDIKKGATADEISKAYPELKWNTKLIQELHFDISNWATIDEINQAYPELKPQEQWFIGWAIEKTGEAFKWGFERIWEAWVGLAEWKYDYWEAAIRWWAWALQSALSPITWLFWETLETWIENIPEDIKARIVEEATPTIEWVKKWYTDQSPEQQRKLQNIGVWSEVLLSFLWMKWIQVSAKPIVTAWKQAITKAKQVITPALLKTAQKVKWVSELPAKWLEWTKQAITRVIPESIVKKDLWFTPTQRAKIEKIVWKTESQYVLEKWLAWKGKEELAWIFAKQADDNFKGITTKLKAVKDTPTSSKVTTQALEDMLDQLSSSKKLQLAYAKDIKAIEGMLKKGKYTLLEKNNTRRAFDKVNTWMFTAQWKARSWIETAVDIDIRSWISKELQAWAKKFWIDIKAMNKELRAWIEMKDSLLRRLSQEERNNFIWLQDIWVSAILSWWEPISAVALIWAKKYWESLAPSLAQKVYKLNKTKDVSSRMTRGSPITRGTKSSKLGLVDSTRDNLVKPTVKKQVKKALVKPKVVKKPVKPTSKKVTKIKKPTKAIKKTIDKKGFVNPQAILDDISKLPKATVKQTEAIARNIVKKLWVAKEHTLQALKIVKSYIKKYWAELKNKLWELFDDLADKTWTRSKFIDDSGKSLDDFGDTVFHGSAWRWTLNSIQKRWLQPWQAIGSSWKWDSWYVFFSQSEDTAKSFATRKWQDWFLLRTKKTPNIKEDLKRVWRWEKQDFITKDTINPDLLEIQVEWGWIPLKDFDIIDFKPKSWIKPKSFNKVGTTKNASLVEEAKKVKIPKTTKVWVKSKFSDKGSYKDIPIINRIDNVTLYQGWIWENRQFWTRNKKYAEQFWKVQEKKGSFYQVDNGNRVIDVFVEVKPR